MRMLMSGVYSLGKSCFWIECHLKCCGLIHVMNTFVGVNAIFMQSGLLRFSLQIFIATLYKQFSWLPIGKPTKKNLN